MKKGTADVPLEEPDAGQDREAPEGDRETDDTPDPREMDAGLAHAVVEYDPARYAAFDISSDAEPETPEADSGEETDTEEEETNTTGGMSRDDLPYVLRRDGVNEGRTMVNVQLRPEVKSQESAFRVSVAEELGLDADDVYAYDLREAMYRVALEHPEAVAEKLAEDGYNLV